MFQSRHWGRDWVAGSAGAIRAVSVHSAHGKDRVAECEKDAAVCGDSDVSTVSAAGGRKT